MDELSPSFEQQIEVDMRRLGSEVAEHRANPETKSLGDKELIKKAIQNVSDESDGAQIDAHVSANGTTIQNPLPDYAASAPAETKLEIEYLLELAFKKGIFFASREARKSSAFVRDAFHDSLAGKLYPELKKRGMI